MINLTKEQNHILETLTNWYKESSEKYKNEENSDDSSIGYKDIKGDKNGNSNKKDLSIKNSSSLDKIFGKSPPKKEVPQYIRLGGYAGTGKTTLISIFRKRLGKDVKVAFCSYTGKATQVLRNKLDEEKVDYPDDNISTIHSLIYYPQVDESSGEIVGWNKQNLLEYDLIIVDEASMVDEFIWNDLLSYNLPILAVGDHGQLPPINSDFNLMGKPNIVLTEIHRQAKSNPIVKLSMHARTVGKILPGDYSRTVKKKTTKEEDYHDLVSEVLESFDSNSLVLCGYNFTRVKLNTHIRNNLGFETSRPEYGDRVICLRNNRVKGIYNGMIGEVQRISEYDDIRYDAEINFPEDDLHFTGLIMKDSFNNPQSSQMKGELPENTDLFDFGYALTVHKAQGSQANKVVLFEERFKKMTPDTWKRWLYTAITRAQEELYIFER